MSNNQPRAFIIDRYARIGDEVFYQQSKESAEWVKPAIPNGTKGVVVGFRRWQQYIGRNETWYARNSHEKAENAVPGLYESNGALIIDWEVPYLQGINATDIYPVDQSILDARQTDKAWLNAYDRKIRIGDLPQLPYYEGDIVELNQPFLTDSADKLVRIRRIDYSRLNEYRNDGGTLMPLYTVSPVHETGPTTSINDVNREPLHTRDSLGIVRLVERGPYWHWDNDRENLKFESIEAEASFYHSVGLAVQIQNPNDGRRHYGFTIRQAVQALKDKIGASINMGGGMFGTHRTPTVYAFPTLPEFEERLRAAFNFKEWEDAFAEGKYPDDEQETELYPETVKVHTATTQES